MKGNKIPDELNSPSFKFFLLKKRYKCIFQDIQVLQSHINNLYKQNLLDLQDRNSIISILFDLGKSLNTQYNQYINQEIENFETTPKEENLTLNHILELNQHFENYQYSILSIENKPFEDTLDKINQIISKYGYNNLINTIERYIGNVNSKVINENTWNFINEINQFVITLGIEKSDIDIDSDYKLIIPDNFEDNDYLELTKILLIKLNSKLTLRVKLYFQNDLININIKSSQITLPLLYDKKTQIIKKLDKLQLDVKFVKSFIKYDNISNIYARSVDQYIEYIQNTYQKFIETVNTSILNLMKNFLAKDTNLKKMYQTIFLLLLGDDENSDFAGILLGLLKEKKNKTRAIYNMFYDNIPFYLQLKLRRSGNNIKEQIEKIKSISTEDINFTKQLVSNKAIPDNIKALTIEKIEEMKSFNNEYFKQLTYVKHVINYPWPSPGEDIYFKNLNQNTDKAKDYLKQVEDKLRYSSFGHEEAKTTLLQVIGKWISNPTSQGSSFGLVGPPGVGKTLLAKSMGDALNIPFAQITLGGQNDGEILHGHGYTYSGSQPGLIIKKMVEMGKSRCILYFDELDKACSKHGQVNEITSILIHLTDPNMNKTFQDRFFQGIDFPLDKVIMIFSYNDSSLVDPILLDRIKEIKVAPYTSNEKLQIIKNFTLPELQKNIGIEQNIRISDNLIEYIIDNYTQEAGVRNLKRKFEEILLNLNMDKIYKKGIFKKNKKYITLTKKIINQILKTPLEDINKIHQHPQIGIINGMYATSNGNGGIVPIQVFSNISVGTEEFDLKLTGKQGDVMKESVNCSYTTATQYLARHFDKYKELNNNLHDYLNKYFKHGFHIHTPSTATPKDGPSAGSAFTCAFVSRILEKPIRNDIAMTGEIELTGRITKIGGLNFKLLGAKKAGIKLVFIPFENKKDVDEIKQKYPKLFDKDFKVEIIEYIDEIIPKILI
jgi:endopeptidase La